MDTSVARPGPGPVRQPQWMDQPTGYGAGYAPLGLSESPQVTQSRSQEGWSMEQFRRFVGLDVHAESVELAVAEWGREAARPLGRQRMEAARLIRRLERLGPVEETLVCYEAGPTGYGLCRALLSAGLACEVIAPSKRQRAPGDRVKTDRRDALALARNLRSGDLTPIHVPDESTEAIRDLVRQRDDAKRAERVAKQQLGGFLLRHGRRRPGTNWTGLHLKWIRGQRFEHEAQQCVLEDGLHAVEEAMERSERITQRIERLIQSSSVADLCTALQALRGVRLVHAATLACEIGDMRRFQQASGLMSFVGLVPSEHSSGRSRRQGEITKTGNAHLRRTLVEAAWSYRYPPRFNHDIKTRNAAVSGAVRSIAWKAQHRLHRRYQRMSARGLNRNRTITAIARELCGFVWAIGHEPVKLAS